MFRCALCAGQDARELLHIDQPDRFEQSIGVAPQGYVRRWIECEQCGGATNVLPEESALRLAALRAAYYEVDFMGSDIGEKYRRVMSMPAGQSDNAGRVARVMDFVRRWSGAPARPRVMDIGAGTGVFLSRLVDQTAGAWQSSVSSQTPARRPTCVSWRSLRWSRPCTSVSPSCVDSTL